MKVLLSADPFLPVPPKHYGGIERIVDGLAGALREKGNEVGLVAHAASTCEVNAFFPWPGQMDWWRATRHMKRAVDEFRPDVVHSFSRLSYLLPLMCSSVPKIMSYQRVTGGANIRVFSRIATQLYFTGCSEYICRQGNRAGGHWTPIHNFVPIENYDFVAQVPDNSPLVFLSRIERIKGAHRAIRIAKAAGRRLIIAGNRAESYEGKVYWETEIAPHLDGHQIRYVGPVNDVEKNQLLGQAAALLVPIQWDEPFGIVFIEALACGTPVISSPRGALPEIINSPELGCLASSDQEALESIKELDRFNRKACREHALGYFSSDVIAKKYISLYRNLFQK